jgi:hypothetical protein
VVNRQWKKGDVIQVALPGQYRYVQLVGRDRENIEVLRVIDVATEEPISDVKALEDVPTAYWFQSFCRILVKDPHFSFVGSGAVSGALPQLRRRFVRGWIVVDGDSEQFFPNPITDDVARISLEEGVPAKVVLDRLSTNWRPESDRDDVVEHLKRVRMRASDAGIDERRETAFFVDFESSCEAEKAKGVLDQRGFTTSHEHNRRSLAIKRQWSASDSLDSMDLLELELLEITWPFGGVISGRETSI